MGYKTILFDADGTLFDFKRSEDEAVRETMESVGITPTESLVADYSKINDGLWKMLERGEIEKNVLLYRRFELFIEHNGFDSDGRKMAETYMQRLSTKGYLIDGAKELIEQLYGKVRIYIITNGVEFIQKGRYGRSGIQKYFDGVFISGVVGYEKPSPKYFDYVEARIPDFKREETLVVGDSLTSDIKGGINAKLDTCWYNPDKKTVPEDMNITYTVNDFDSIYKIIMS